MTIHKLQRTHAGVAIRICMHILLSRTCLTLQEQSLTSQARLTQILSACSNVHMNGNDASYSRPILGGLAVTQFS